MTRPLSSFEGPHSGSPHGRLSGWGGAKWDGGSLRNPRAQQVPGGSRCPRSRALEGHACLGTCFRGRHHDCGGDFLLGSLWLLLPNADHATEPLPAVLPSSAVRSAGLGVAMIGSKSRMKETRPKKNKAVQQQVLQAVGNLAMPPTVRNRCPTCSQR